MARHRCGVAYDDGDSQDQYRAGDVAYALVTRQTRSEIEANVDLLFLGNDKTFWRIELAARSAQEIATVAAFNDVRRSFDPGDGRTVGWREAEGVSGALCEGRATPPRAAQAFCARPPRSAQSPPWICARDS